MISGYLITSIIVREIDAGSFSIARFYERRIRRIFPALVAVLIASSIISCFILIPSDLKNYGNSLIASVFFYANMYFYSDVSYFDSPGMEKPLLHLCSLGVEEQFYIFIPLILFLLLNYMKSTAKKLMALTLLILLSFVYSCVQLQIVASAAFYLLPSRAWELLFGSLLGHSILSLFVRALSGI